MNGILFLIIGFAAGLTIGKLVFGRVTKTGLASEQTQHKEENKKKITEALEGRDKITNDEVEKLLGVSNATAERYLNELEKEGIIRQVGETGRSVYYIRR